MYYVYALLDSRKPGTFCYVLENGKRASFDYEPFYIGKGKGNRMRVHVPTALLGVEQTFKARRIRRIVNQGFRVIEKRSIKVFDEKTAFNLERMLINAIGRFDLCNGPLCNLTDGGDGVPRLPSHVRTQIAQASRDWWASLSKTQKAKQVAKYSEWWERIGHEGRNLFAKRKQADANAFISRMTLAEYIAYTYNKGQRVRDWWASLSPEQLNAYKKTQSVVQRERWAKVTPGDRKKHGAKVQHSISEMTPERKSIYRERKQKSAKEWYNSLSPRQRAEMKRKQDQAKRNYPVRICPHCGVSGKGGNMTRFHFSNCKHVPQ
jgi:hypothetical protein